MRGRLEELEGRLVQAAEAYERAVALDPQSASLQSSLAGVRARMGQEEAALVHAMRAFELAPDDEPIRRMLAALYVSLKRYQEAVALLDPQFDRGELSQDGRFQLFGLHLHLEQMPRAQQVAEQMIEDAPGDLRGYFALGAVLERADRVQEAEALYRRALEQTPYDPRILDSIARLRRLAGDRDGEIAVLREKLKIHPGDSGALSRLVQVYEQADDRDAVVATLEEILQHHPQQLTAQLQLGYMYYQADRVDDAVALFEGVLEGAGQLSEPAYLDELRYFLGLAYRASGAPERALQVLGDVGADGGRLSEARLLMARIYEQDERFDDALAEARRAAAVDPDHSSIYVYLAGLLQRSGDLPGAVKMMEDLIASDPNDPEFYYDLGVIYGDAKNEDRAVEFMLQAIALDDDHASALNYVGYTWADQGVRLEEAEAMIRRAVNGRPDDGYIADSLGWVHYKRGLKLLNSGDSEKAREAFESAIDVLERSLELLEEDDPIITRHLGDVYRTVSRLEDALATYRRALTLEPSEEDATEIQRQIELLELQSEGESDGAVAR